VKLMLFTVTDMEDAIAESFEAQKLNQVISPTRQEVSKSLILDGNIRVHQKQT
jgi:hypothetical protein